MAPISSIYYGSLVISLLNFDDVIMTSYDKFEKFINGPVNAECDKVSYVGQ